MGKPIELRSGGEGGVDTVKALTSVVRKAGVGLVECFGNFNSEVFGGSGEGGIFVG